MFNRMRAVTFAALMLATASPVIVNNTAVAQVQRPTKIASTVLATVNGQQLTQSMVDSAIELGEFMADHKFTAADKRWIIDSEVKLFRNNPNKEIQAYRQIAQILSQIKQSRDPVQLAQARESLMSGTYLNLLQNNQLTYLLFLKERGFLDASLGCATLRSLTIPPRPFRVSQCPRLTI
ncbi:MAG: hypothetical protein WBA39_34955, partial [Rivularia sp. (in: cyanobacteria)]